MELAAVAVRWLHAAGAVSLVGIFASLVLVARPAVLFFFVFFIFFIALLLYFFLFVV
jgi:hypothetical protein